MPGEPMRLIYMAKIATERGINWYCIGECDGDEDALSYAKIYTKAVLGGVASQVKEIMPKHNWIEIQRLGENRWQRKKKTKQNNKLGLSKEQFKELFDDNEDENEI